jgi:hypothetical protein
MKFKIGNTVIFLNEKGGGVVSRIVNKTTVNITTDEGFELPYEVSQLVFVNDVVDTIAPKRAIETIEESSFEVSETFIENEKENGIYIAFSPENLNDIHNSNFNLWYINHSTYHTLFTFSVLRNNKYTTLETGSTESFQSLLIRTIDKKEIENFANFKIDILFYYELEHDEQQPVSKIIKFKITKLYQENIFKENKFIDEHAYIRALYLFDENLNKPSDLSSIELAKKLFNKKTNKELGITSIPHTKNNPDYDVEIDIHIEELMDDYSHLDNYGIVQVQLKHFQKALDNAISKGCRTLTVIHGIGTGVLKKEVRHLISSHYHLQYMDASFQKYGTGATVVLLNK